MLPCHGPAWCTPQLHCQDLKPHCPGSITGARAALTDHGSEQAANRKYVKENLMLRSHTSRSHRAIEQLARPLRIGCSPTTRASLDQAGRMLGSPRNTLGGRFAGTSRAQTAPPHTGAESASHKCCALHPRPLGSYAKRTSARTIPRAAVHAPGRRPSAPKQILASRPHPGTPLPQASRCLMRLCETAAAGELMPSCLKPSPAPAPAPRRHAAGGCRAAPSTQRCCT